MDKMQVDIEYLPNSNRVSEVRVSTTYRNPGYEYELLGVECGKFFTSDGKVKKEYHNDWPLLSSHKNRSREGKLLGETLWVLKGRKVNFTYDSDESLSSLSFDMLDRQIFFDFNKGRLIRGKELFLTTLGGVFRENVAEYDEKKRVVKYTIKNVMEGTQKEYYLDKKGRWKKIIEKKENQCLKEDQCTQTTYNLRGEMVKQKIQMGADKCVEIEPSRSLGKKIWDSRKEGATFGQVKRVELSEKRSKVNADLKAIWASQLSPEEKKEKLRKVAAAFRVVRGRAPNPQVYKKLVKIHQQER